VYTQQCSDKIIDGFTDDINFDADFIYYNKVNFEGAAELMTKLKDKASREYSLLTEAMNTSSETQSNTVMNRLCSGVIIKQELFRTSN
jgi:hypothetical protein